MGWKSDEPLQSCCWPVLKNQPDMLVCPGHLAATIEGLIEFENKNLVQFSPQVLYQKCLFHEPKL